MLPNKPHGVHYGANKVMWKAFVVKVPAFLAKSLAP